MKQYRVVLHEHCGSKTYLLQKKSFLGFWYNPLNLDAHTTGYYDSLDKAKLSIARKITPVKKTIVYEKSV